MEITIEESPVTRKTKELCQTLLDEPGVRSIRQRIDAFLDDEKASTQYEELVAKGQALQEKQQNAEQAVHGMTSLSGVGMLGIEWYRQTPCLTLPGLG